MDDYIQISTLNDFIFCPYSIYLHNIYMDADESLYHATPQTKGRIAHEKVDNKTTSHSKSVLQYSVYEVNNTKRILDNLRILIKDKFAKLFTPDDSVVIMEVNIQSVEKYGCAIHRDQPAVFL